MEYLKRAEPEEGVAQQAKDSVSKILSAVKREGIAAVRRYSEQFDDWNLDSFWEVEGTEQVGLVTAISDAGFFYGHALTARIRQERVEQKAGT